MPDRPYQYFELTNSICTADLRRIRFDALEKLNRYNISTTLVVTVKKGVNDGELGKIVDFALQQRCAWCDVPTGSGGGTLGGLRLEPGSSDFN